MILIIVTFPKISMNPLYVTSRYLFPSFCWFIICVQQSFQLGISISNSQTIGKIYLVIIKSIWILIKCIDWSLEDGISHEKIQLRRIFYRTIITNYHNVRVRTLSDQGSVGRDKSSCDPPEWKQIFSSKTF